MISLSGPPDVKETSCGRETSNKWNQKKKGEMFFSTDLPASCVP